MANLVPLRIEHRCRSVQAAMERLRIYGCWFSRPSSLAMIPLKRLTTVSQNARSNSRPSPGFGEVPAEMCFRDQAQTQVPRPHFPLGENTAAAAQNSAELSGDAKFRVVTALTTGDAGDPFSECFAAHATDLIKQLTDWSMRLDHREMELAIREQQLDLEHRRVRQAAFQPPS